MLQDGKAVAVKLFKGEVSPDGRAADEIDVTCAVDHPNLTKCAPSAMTATMAMHERLSWLRACDVPGGCISPGGLVCHWS